MAGALEGALGIGTNVFTGPTRHTLIDVLTRVLVLLIGLEAPAAGTDGALGRLVTFMGTSMGCIAGSLTT